MKKDYKLEQHAFRELAKPKFIPAGTPYKYTNREGEEVENPNHFPSTRRHRRQMMRIRPDKSRSLPKEKGTNHERLVARRNAREAAKSGS